MAQRSINCLLPLILKRVIEGMTCEDAGRKKKAVCDESEVVYLFVGLYAATKFTADFFNYIRELPFCMMQATAET